MLKLKNISKRFPGIVALDDVSFDIADGQIHALMGENGAGKSTLMKILAGIYKADAGEILLNDKKVEISNPSDSIKQGISMIYQELNPIPEMSVAENIFLNREPCYIPFGIINRKKLIQKTTELLGYLKVNLNPNAKMSSLSISEQQIVEITKAVSFNSNIIIMDEPTSAITEREVETLFNIIRDLSSKGKSVIYISHKMDEIFKIADCVTVLRDGKYIDTKPVPELTTQKLISMMVGRELKSLFPKEDVEPGNTMLEVKDLSSKEKFSGISFKVHAGEILGIAGLMGSGRTEVAEAIFGMRKLSGGEIYVNNKKIKINSPEDAISNKIAFITEDRRAQGLNLKGSVKENITISSLKKYCLFSQFINLNSENLYAEQQINSLKIKVSKKTQLVNTLSGGNQQKVVLAKWLLCDPDVLILDEPTRGIDVNAKAEIYKIMVNLAKNGKAIIMISSEMAEILSMSDRVIVFHEGKQQGEFVRNEFDQEKIMECATGNSRGVA